MGRKGRGVNPSLKGRLPEFFSDDQKAMQLIVALACLAVTVSIGYTYANHIQVVGWQLWTWLVSVLIAALALLAGAGRPPLTWQRYWWWLAGLLLMALLLRLVLIEIIPGGLHVDEVGTADFSLRHVFIKPQETVNPFRAGLASQPTLYNYLIRLSLAVVGKSITGLRLSSVLAGTLAILATYAMVAVYQNRRAALFAALLMTTYHYHIHWSRLGLNNIWDTLWVPAMLAPFAWGWRKNWSGGAVLAGLAVGLSQYFYMGNKIGFFLMAFVILHFWQEGRGLLRGNRQLYNRRLVIYTGVMLLMAAIVAAPIFFHALRQPDVYFERSRMVFAFSPEILASGEVLNFAWEQIVYSAGAFTAMPDRTGFYGPGVPLLIGIAAPLFAIGFFWAIYKRRYLPALWVVLTVVLGGFFMQDPPSSSHFVVAIPAVCWLMAIPLAWLVERGRWQWAVLLVGIIMVTDLVYYFGYYVPSEPRDLIHAFPPWPPLN